MDIKTNNNLKKEHLMIWHLFKSLPIIILAVCLNACSGIFWTDNIVTSDDKQHAKQTYAQAHRIQVVPASVSLLRVENDLVLERLGDKVVVRTELPIWGMHTYSNGKTIKGDGKPFVYYEGTFVNPMPITAPSGNRYLLDFRKYAQKDGDYDGKIYLLKPNGKPYMNNGRPQGAGYFKLN